MKYELIDIDALPLADLHDLRLQRLSESLASWSVHLPLLSKDGQTMRPAMNDPRDDLRCIPLTTGAFVGENCPPYSDVLQVRGANGVALRSGGTTGKRKTVIHSHAFFEKVMAMGARGIAASGLHPRAIANCFTPGNLWGGFLFGNGVAAHLQATCFPLGSNAPQEEIADVIQDFSLDCLFASPSFAHSLLTNPAIRTQKFEGLETIFYVGEPLKDIHERQILERLPRVKIKSLAYTSNETGCIGYQCEAQSGGFHHIHDDEVFLEIIDPVTEAEVAPNESGEVVVTTLRNDGMPMVRYRMGDLARFVAAPCKCNRKSQVIELLGRTDASKKICGYLVSLQSIAATLKPIVEIPSEHIQVVTRTSRGETTIEIHVASETLAESVLQDAERSLLSHPTFSSLLGMSSVRSVTLKSTPLRAFLRSTVSGKVASFHEEVE